MKPVIFSNPAPYESESLGIEVPISSIEVELRKLWEQDEARTNAALMNLVVYSEAPGSLYENSKNIRDLTRDHACRAILVEITRSIPEPTLRAWITAHCHLAHGRKSVCCEQISFHLTGRVTGRFRNSVFAHLNADLPVVFWWQGELSDVLNNRLANVMERLIVDSSSWVDLEQGLDRLQQAAAANTGLILQDHAWTRTWQFRVGIAGLFDDALAKCALEQIDTIEIVYHPDHRMSALQLVAWLAVQAGWSDDETDPRRLVTKDGVVIDVRLIEDPDGAPISRTELCAGALHARVTREAGSPYVVRELEGPEVFSRSLGPADPESSVELVALQLARGGRNSLFQKILPRFRILLETWGAGLKK